MNSEPTGARIYELATGQKICTPIIGRELGPRERERLTPEAQDMALHDCMPPHQERAIRRLVKPV